MRSEVPCERLLRLGRPVDVLSTLAPLRHGRWDPTVRLDGSDVWRTTRTEHGPATVHYRPTGTGRDGAAVRGGPSRSPVGPTTC